MTRNAAIAASGGEGWQRALLLLDLEPAAFGASGLRVQVTGCNAAIGACQRGAEWRSSLALLSSTQSELGAGPDEVAYNSAVSTCASAGRFDEALQLLDGMLGTGMTPGLSAFTTLMLMLAGAGRDKEAAEVFRRAFKAGVVTMWISPGILELHDMPLQVARLAVSTALEDIREGRYPADRGLLILVGRGLRSEGGEAVLRPAIEAMLREEFGLPSHPDAEGGALRIRAKTLCRHLGLPLPDAVTKR
eukprot:CAMPEP_0171255392 /NCGR_PEP_ID=MMETSP0790-20130122/52747_1 /TAXON_ID=2925 /ORGANISM="Alexandrium catenella, Strain OF101" /LENGTH=246 /DNA_ID=CAMNT_0011723351 /DNA_START=3 /DNA_END=740 /DNA_ORIENTATION=+